MAKPLRPFTDEWVLTLPHPSEGEPESKYPDPVLARHRLVVSRTKKTFEVQGEVPKQHRANGKRQTYKVQVGDAPMTKVADARLKAVAVLDKIARGEDPRPAAQPKPKVTTLGFAWENYRDRADLRKSTTDMYEKLYELCLRQWADEPLLTLAMNPAKARDEHRRITKDRGPVTANKAMTLLRSIHRHAAQLDTSLSFERHPCTAVEFNAEKPKDAAIPAAVMPAWGAQLGRLREESPIRASFQMLCLRMGTRPGELAERKWSDIEGDVLVLPETKTHLVEVPIVPQIAAELERVREAGTALFPGSIYVFPARAGGHLSRLTEPKTKLSHSGNSGRHTHHTIGTVLGPRADISELTLDVLEGRSLLKAGAAGRGYIARSELPLRAAQQAINDEIDRLLSAGSESNHGR